MTPTDLPEANDFDQARNELSEGIESSRAVLRQSRILIELSESDGAHTADNDNFGQAN